MFYRKEGFPEEGDIVLCTVDRITYNSVFVKLDEYGDLEGMIHISEVSPGRIRNLRDYVREGKKIVCKVLRANPKTMHIELSLRRVNEHQRRSKNNEIKQEQIAEKIIEITASRINENVKKLYESIAKKVFKDYMYIYDFFCDIIKDEKLLERYKLPKKTNKILLQLIKERIKPKQAQIENIVSIKTYASNGIGVIKKAFLILKEYNAQSSYIGGGRYKISLTGEDYKVIEGVMEELKRKIKSIIQREKYSEISFQRIEKK